MNHQASSVFSLCIYGAVIWGLSQVIVILKTSIAKKHASVLDKVLRAKTIA